MARFFDKFPVVSYKLSGKRYSGFDIVTNIFFRTSMIRDVLSNSSAYVKYVIKDGDTPEILAAKAYNDPEAHWIILYANEIVDPLFEWPKTTSQFYKYIADKYRPQAEAYYGRSVEDYEVIAWTQSKDTPETIHHYEKVIKKENLSAQTVDIQRFVINKSKLSNAEIDLGVPFDYYDDITLPAEQGVTPFSTPVAGQTIIETIYKDLKSIYEYEEELNESRRNIRIIKNNYYTQIVQEFSALTRTDVPGFFRRVS